MWIRIRIMGYLLYVWIVYVVSDGAAAACLIMQNTGVATWDLTSFRKPRDGVSPPSLYQGHPGQTKPVKKNIQRKAVQRNRPS